MGEPALRRFFYHPLFLTAQKGAADQYRQLAGAGSEQTSNDLKEIIPAAYHGQGGVYLWS